jgi:hypothetical protein
MDHRMNPYIGHLSHAIGVGSAFTVVDWSILCECVSCCEQSDILRVLGINDGSFHHWIDQYQCTGRLIMIQCQF